MKAKEKLYSLYTEVKREDNAKEYINELLIQLRLFGTESNSLTRQSILNELKELVFDIENTLN